MKLADASFQENCAEREAHHTKARSQQGTVMRSIGFERGPDLPPFSPGPRCRGRLSSALAWSRGLALARKRDAPMAQDVETIAEFIREAPDAGAAYRAMLRQVIRAGEQVLGPERA